jgi:hypothetical protein
MTFFILIVTGILICWLFAVKANAEIERARQEAAQYRARQDLEIQRRERNRWAALDQGGKRFKQRGTKQ